MIVDVKSIKEKQDYSESRKNNLVKRFIPFRESFIAYLENFVIEAMECGVKDISPLDKAKSTKEITKISASVNSIPFDILSTAEAFLSNDETDSGDVYSAKIFIYVYKSQHPHIIITFQEAKEDKNTYYAKWKATDGLEWLMGRSAVIDPKISGEEAGNKLIQHFYSFTFFWNELPVFDKFESDRYSKKSFGFVK